MPRIPFPYIFTRGSTRGICSGPESGYKNVPCISRFTTTNMQDMNLCHPLRYASNCRSKCVAKEAKAERNNTSEPPKAPTQIAILAQQSSNFTKIFPHQRVRTSKNNLPCSRGERTHLPTVPNTIFIIIKTIHLYPTMKFTLALALVGSAAAFAPQASVSRLLLLSVVCCSHVWCNTCFFCSQRTPQIIHEHFSHHSSLSELIIIKTKQ